MDTYHVRIVLGDQDAERRTLLGDLLRSEGYDVAEAECVADVSCRIGADDDLVIMGTAMGPGVAAILNGLGREPRGAGPLVLLLAPPTEGSKGKAESLEAGADGYLALPVERAVFLATVRALVRLRATQRAIERSEATLRRIAEERDGFFALSPDLCCVVDANGRFVRVNAAWKSSCGFSEEDLLGSACKRLAHPEDIANATACVEQLRAGKPVAFELRQLCADGAWRWFAWTTMPSADGAIYYGIGRDISGRKADEQEQQRSARELSRSNAELERFSYAASHDLKEPLRMISQYVALIGRRYADRFDERGLEFLDFVTDGATRMQAMLDALLEYARSGSADMKPASVDLGIPLRDAMRNLRTAIAAEGASIVVTADLPTVHGDVILLTQLFQNLIANALKYRSQAVPVVTIHAEAKDQQWTVRVSDNGIGVRREDAVRIFEPFQRAAPGGASSGSGIGLATCRRIVERHGGVIWVESDPGGGATFSFTVPCGLPHDMGVPR